MKIYNVLKVSYDIHGDAEASIVSSVSDRESAIAVLEVEAEDLLSEVLCEDEEISAYYTSEDHSSLEYDWEGNGFKLVIQETDLVLPETNAIWMIDYEWNPRNTDRGHQIIGPFHYYADAQLRFAQMKAKMITEFAARYNEGDCNLHDDTDFHCLIETNHFDEWEEITIRQF